MCEDIPEVMTESKAWRCDFCKPGCVLRQGEKPKDGFCMFADQIPKPKWYDYDAKQPSERF